MGASVRIKNILVLGDVLPNVCASMRIKGYFDANERQRLDFSLDLTKICHRVKGSLNLPGLIILVSGFLI